MSEHMPIGLTVTEKLFGLILTIIGVIVVYSSLNPPAGDISHFSSIFVVTGVVIAMIGIFLFIAKAE